MGEGLFKVLNVCGIGGYQNWTSSNKGGEEGLNSVPFVIIK